MSNDTGKYQLFLWRLLKEVRGKHGCTLIDIIPSSHEGVIEIHVCDDRYKENVIKIYIDSQNISIPFPNLVRTIPLEAILNNHLDEKYVSKWIFEALHDQRQHVIQQTCISNMHKELMEAKRGDK